jgi:hypothetical protein
VTDFPGSSPRSRLMPKHMTSGLSMSSARKASPAPRNRWTGRPWSEMMTALHSNGVRTIIIEKLDRLARDLMIQEATIADLQRDGFTLVSVQEPDLMASDPSRIAFRQMMGVFAQYDKSQIVLKLRVQGFASDRLRDAAKAANRTGHGTARRQSSRGCVSYGKPGLDSTGLLPRSIPRASSHAPAPDGTVSS